MRQAQIDRKTRETDISLFLSLDGERQMSLPGSDFLTTC